MRPFRPLPPASAYRATWQTLWNTTAEHHRRAPSEVNQRREKSAIANSQLPITKEGPSSPPCTKSPRVYYFENAQAQAPSPGVRFYSLAFSLS